MRSLRGAVLALLLAFAPQSVHADPLIAGCCDSITSSYPSEPSYLDLLWAEYPPSGTPSDHNLGVDSSSSTDGLTRLQTYLGGQDPDAVIVLSGTPDAGCSPGGWCPSNYPGELDPPNDYSQDFTVANVTAMVDAVLADSTFSEPVLVAPPPVYEPCTGADPLPCAEMDERLYDLSVALGDVAVDRDVAFVDLYALFDAHPDPGPLFRSDGVHPNWWAGDPFIADAVFPKLADIFCGNGLLDPGETCDGTSGCPATCGVVADCLDGVDNDGDGTVDFGEDFGCDSPYDASERTTPGVIACDDGVDNDGDGLADFPDDPGCGHPALTLENPECNDGVDNDDADDLIDFDGGLSALGYVAGEPDPDCNLAHRSTEEAELRVSSVSCGLGVELALLLPPLMWWRRKRR